MAKLVMTNANVTLAGTDITTNVASVTLTISAAEVETTAMGNTAVTRVGGLQDNSLTLSVHQDFASVDALLYPLIGSTTSFIVKPNGSSAGTANPSYSGTVLIAGDYSPVNGAVGELATFDLTLPISGTVARATA